MWSIARSSNPNDEVVDLTGTREERLAEVRATFGDNFIIVYTTLTRCDSYGVVFFPTEAYAWSWIAGMLASGEAARNFSIYNSRGFKLGEANNTWDEVMRAEHELFCMEQRLFHVLTGIPLESLLVSVRSWMDSRPTAAPNQSGLPQHYYSETERDARMEEVYARSSAIDLELEAIKARTKQQ